jgi:ribosomal protein L37AE/L43A
MICENCKQKTKNSRYVSGLGWICRVCYRKENGLRWRWFRLLQILKFY